MNSAGKKRDKAMHRIVNRMVKKEYEGWPPGCGVFLYQPKRPPRATRDTGGKDTIQ